MDWEQHNSLITVLLPLSFFYSSEDQPWTRISRDHAIPSATDSRMAQPLLWVRPEMGDESMLSCRKHERFELQQKVNWDFYSARTGLKIGYVANISNSGCLFQSSEEIEHRRWLRMIINQQGSNLHFSTVGRVVRREVAIDVFEEIDFTLYRYGVEFIFPAHLSFLILALSNKNLSVDSCRSLNARSSLRPGSFA